MSDTAARRLRAALLLTCSALALACATTPPPITRPARVPAVTIVILTSQGVAPGEASGEI